MPLATHLIHRCTIQRSTKTLDAYRNTVETWRDVAVDVQCKLVAGSQTVFSDEQAQFFTLTKFKVLLPAGTDIQTADRVANVVYEDGSTDAGPFTVNAVLPRRGIGLHHISVQVTR